MIGINPVTDRVSTVESLLRLIDQIRLRYQIPVQSCILAHVTTQMEALRRGAPVDLVFQSIAGTEKANASFGVNLALLVDVAAGGLLLGGLYALIAVGLNLQYGLMRVLNVAHGELLMIGGYLTYLLHVHQGVNPLLSLLITGPVVFALGVAVHGLLAAPCAQANRGL